jgi:hemolysin activation/secretion protein
VPTPQGSSRLKLAHTLLPSLSALVLSTLSFGSHGAELLAQAPAGAVPNIDQLRPPVPTTKEGPEASMPQQAEPPKEMGKPQDDVKVNVKRFVVDPSTPPELQSALDQLTAPFTGPDRSYEDLMNAVSAVTRYLQRDLDLYLGYAYLPAQQPVDGEIKIAVLEGRLDQVMLNWRDDIPVDKAVVEAHLARLQPGSVLHVKDVERVVFLLNDLRGLTARFEIKQGRVPGTASLVVTPTPEKRVSGKFEFDANGSRFSGIYRAGVTTNIASPLNKGDGMVVSTQITNGGGLFFLLGGYTLPVGSNGLKAGLSVSNVQYHLSPEVPLHLKGEATAVSTYALYPLVRSRNLNMFAQTSFEQRDFIDRKGDLGDTADAAKRTYEFRVGIAGDFRDNWLLGGVSTYEVAGSVSQVNYLKNGPPLAVFDNKNRNRLNLGFSRLNNLISNRLLAYVSVSAQKSWQNLDTTEQFGIGGPGRVRAFAPGEGTGDEGQVGSVELRWLPPESLMGRYARETVFSAFYDWGHVRFKHDASKQALGFVPDAVFSGYGVGATWERPQVVGARLSVAWPKQGEAQNDVVSRVPRVYATVTAPF